MPPTTTRTTTFLLTDIEGSTRLWEQRREAMAVALEVHDSMLRSVVESAGGTVVKTTGDGLLAAFDRPESAVGAALEGQHALDRHEWPGTGPLRVRMAIHSGSADVRDGDFFGPALNRVARLLAIGHGGQVLVSGATAILVADGLPPESELIDRGEHRLRDLHRSEHVYQLAAPGLRREFPPLRSAAPGETNLPVQVTSFVGRERELADITRLLAAGHLVTLVGVGGTGKTRLMLEAAARTDRYPGGAWLVELAPISDPGLVVEEVTRALGVQDQSGRPLIDALVDYLRSKELLLLLDNCEHLIGAAADVTHRLLENCPDLTILASSREPLGVAGEVVFAVPSLALPDAVATHEGHVVMDPAQLERAAGSDAVRLFVDRAAAVLPSFTLDAASIPAAVEICRRLDGIPLALELAAARVNVLSVAEIAQGLGDRFRLLTGGRRTAAPRQQTLQAAIDWSWSLLTEPDRRLLRRLSVFSGGWTLEAAATVTTDPAPGGATSGGGTLVRLATLDGLSRLVDRSLVAVDREGSTRYQMLETIRQYAGDRLLEAGETVELRDRQLRVFRELAREAEPGLLGPEMVAWLARLDAEVDNLRSSLDWAFETDPIAALEMCAALTPYWRSHPAGSEGFDRLMHAVAVARTLLAGPSPSPELQALAGHVLAQAALATAAYTGGGASDLVGESIVIAQASGDQAAIADALVSRLTYLAIRATEPLPPGAIEEAIRLAEGSGDRIRLSAIQAGAAMQEVWTDPAAAERRLEDAAEIARGTGNPYAMANVAQIRGRVASISGQLADARRLFLEAAGQFRVIGDRNMELVCLSEVAHALRRDGLLDEAEEAYRETIHRWQHGGNRGAIANQLECFGYIALARGVPVRAATLLGAAEVLRERAAAPMPPQERPAYDAEIDRLRGLLDEGARASAWAEGQLMTSDEAVAFALSE